MQRHKLVRIDVNDADDAERGFGDRLADGFASVIGSWRFIIIQSIVLATWIILNSLAWTFHWVNYPYVLCNLVLSSQAAFSVCDDDVPEPPGR